MLLDLLLLLLLKLLQLGLLELFKLGCCVRTGPSTQHFGARAQLGTKGGHSRAGTKARAQN